MKILIALLLLGFAQSAAAITKCEVRGKVTYKRGSCPQNAETRILVKDKYIKEQDLYKFQQDRDSASDKAIKKMTAPKIVPAKVEEVVESKSPKKPAEKVKMSSESVHFQLKKVEDLNRKTGKIYSPNMPDDLSGKLEDMELKVKEHNKALQQLQKK